MVTNKGFMTWLKQQCEDYPDIDPEFVFKVQFTTSSIYHEKGVHVEILQFCKSEQGRKYLVSGTHDAAREMHVIPVKSLT